MKEVDHIFNLNHPLLEIISEKYFYYKEKTEFYKPNPKVFNTILKSHAESPNEVLYIGDTIIDAFAAKFAGLFFIATLESQLTTQINFPQEMVDGFINKISDLQMYKSLFKTIKFNNLQNQVEILIDNQKFSVPQNFLSTNHPKIKEILNSLLP